MPGAARATHYVDTVVVQLQEGLCSDNVNLTGKLFQFRQLLLDGLLIGAPPQSGQVVDLQLQGVEELHHVPEVAGADEDQGCAVHGALVENLFSSRNLSQINSVARFIMNRLLDFSMRLTS